jgi:hypothetical protein
MHEMLRDVIDEADVSRALHETHTELTPEHSTKSPAEYCAGRCIASVRDEVFSQRCTAESYVAGMRCNNPEMTGRLKAQQDCGLNFSLRSV